MYDFENMDKRYIIFGNTFLTANRLQSVMDSTGNELTAKQWLVITMLGMFDTPPTLVQLAKMCDSTHQNTKQIVLKLEKKDFIRIEKDKKDKRAMRILKTEKCKKWDEANKEFAKHFINEMFCDLTENEISYFCNIQQKIYKRLEKMEVTLK
ncbi:MAG: MarR family transcriptional regulator [Anaerovorax sp.]|nr:MarR family transcriptional regulator [Anaerovorax sp.]